MIKKSINELRIACETVLSHIECGLVSLESSGYLKEELQQALKNAKGN